MQFKDGNVDKTRIDGTRMDRIQIDGVYYTLWDALEILRDVMDDIKTIRNISGLKEESDLESRIQHARNIIGAVARGGK